ncbi:CaiB/BaiF CoA transferase family protein [Bordetella genomosp. 13]|uniref:CaiB/BaiF CoA transferase family protein n=1 Tax=Bordetella genomosp. 13 TaxID=463040 RepID=UPI0011A8FD8B|nr:CoA transferase [Bordetella genomosp. 13]
MTQPDSLSTPAAAPVRGPLDGVRVLDLSAYIAGPYGCALLADQGAEVIKVEPPQGDNFRNYPSTLAAEGRAFLGVNRGKRGIVLDLKTPQGKDALLRLVDQADVLVHNFRPSVPARLGIDYEALRQRNPRLVYCALTGYGDSGPMKDSAGYDQVLQTMTGICTFQGAPGDAEIVYGSVVDYYAAALLSGSVASALYQRERTGHGQYVGVSLLGSALAMQSARFVWAESESRDVWRDMRSGGITGLHPTREGSIYLSANTPHFWEALCELVGLPDMGRDPRYDSVRKRAEHAGVIVPRLRQALQAHGATEWADIFGVRVPCAPARPIEDMFDHPQVLSQDLVHAYEHPKVGTYRGLARPVRFGDAAVAAPCAAPTLGQHTEQVLRESGLSDDELDALRAAVASP